DDKDRLMEKPHGKSSCWKGTVNHSGMFLTLWRRPLPLPADQGIGPDRLLGADEAVAVGVDLVEQLVAARELAPGHVAVAVLVHLAEPERAGPRFRRRPRTVVLSLTDLISGVHVAAVVAHRTVAGACSGPAPHKYLAMVRHVTRGEVALATVVEPFDELGGLLHLVDAQPPSVVAAHHGDRARPDLE